MRRLCLVLFIWMLVTGADFRCSFGSDPDNDRPDGPIRPPDSNRAPVASDAAYSVPGDQELRGAMPAVDPDGDALTWRIEAGPSLGSVRDLDSRRGTFTYVPDETGADSFSFRASDGRLDSNAASVRIAVLPALGIDLLPRAIASYLELHPETRFAIESLHHRQVARALKEFKIDIGLVFDPPDMPGISTDVLALGRFVVLTHDSMDFPEGESLTLADLEGMPLVSLSTRSPLGKLLDQRIASSGLKMRSVAEVETYQMAKSLVAHGAGVAIIDDITARSMGHDNVVSWQLEPELNYKVALLHVESEPLSIVTQRFVDHLATELGRFLQ